MGNSNSRLDTLSSQEVGDAVCALGTKYEGYALCMIENGIDGGLLESVDEQELIEMMDELEISSKIHRKVLTRAFHQAKTATTTSDGSEKGNDLASAPNITQKGSIDASGSNATTNDCSGNYPNEEANFAAADVYEYSCKSPSSDVKGFDTISSKVMESNPSANYGAVHLVLRDGTISVSSKIRTPAGACLPMDRSIVKVEPSRCNCYDLVMKSQEDFVIWDAQQDKKPILGDTYVGHVIKNDQGNRVGSVCFVSSQSVEEAKQDTESIQDCLAELSVMAEAQLREREQLLRRNKLLQKQISDIKQGVTEASGPDEKMQGTTESKEPEQEQGNKDASPAPNPAVAPVHLDSSLLPFATSNLATESERAHLPSTLWDRVDSLGMPRPPISKDDMARVARVEALGFHNIDPNGAVAQQLKRILSMLCSVFKYPLVSLSVHTHDTEFLVGCHDDLNGKVFDTLPVKKRDSAGSPFCVAMGRGPSTCNYTTHKRSTFVVPDMLNDGAFMNNQSGLRGYVGTPIITSDGFVVANLCMFDFQPRYDFTPAKQTEYEKIALMITQHIENWELRRMMDRLVEERERLLLLGATTDKTKAPTGEVTIVLTDIQGSTALWEADAAAMKEALTLHDSVLRKCSSNHHGYEIKTEGDAFHLAFHDPMSAICFALEAQVELYNAPWSDGILALSDAAHDELRMLRGPRVRMGMHHGRSTPQLNDISGRASYHGETFRIAQSLEALCHGGQILTSSETWRMVSELREKMQSPQVVDYGEYILLTGESICDGVIAKRVVQLVPKQLSFDYFKHSGNESSKETNSRKAARARGRQFSQPASKRRLSTSFLDAPKTNGIVAMMFVYPCGTNDLAEPTALHTFAVLTKAVRSLLLKVSPPGYECQEDKGKWMIAFNTIEPAIKFGLLLLDALNNAPFHEKVDRRRIVRVGIHSGQFSGMGPHPMHGRADYFGPVVNRAARVAAATDAGTVCLGIPVIDPTDTPVAPDVGSDVSLNFVGVKELKGVNTGMAMFHCEDSTRHRIAMILSDEGNDVTESSSQ